MFRAVIVSDALLYRQGLSQILRNDDRVAITYDGASCEEVLNHLREATVDVVLLDIAMPDSLQTSRNIRSSSPDTKIVALGVIETPTSIIACAEAGVSGYVCRGGSLADLVRAVECATNGELDCSRQIAGALMKAVAGCTRGQAIGAGRLLLTDRKSVV